ncbi:MAG TPA: hypothetical protein VFI28_02465 [Candidatus Limnocylindrales bacterium]|nr:hypothetical protein [Candidatus Limnocylindrales bacterium]
MPSTILEDVQPGWHVYAGTEEVGRVADLGEHELSVRRGTLIHHTYRVPEVFVAEAYDGVVDLAIDKPAFDRLEVGAGPGPNDTDDSELGAGDPGGDSAA